MPEVFREEWESVVERKGTTLCAGVDPSEFTMGRTGKGEGLLAGADKRDWALKYVTAVAPHVAAIKPNLRYWGSFENLSEEGKLRKPSDLQTVREMIDLAHNLGLVVIQDSKEADIGSTNDAGIFYASMRNADAVTLAAFVGNVEEAARQAKEREIGLIGMCLMSNPEYEDEKNMWRSIEKDRTLYTGEHIKLFDGIPYVRRYVQLARDAAKHNLDGIVLGAPSAKNHITEEEVSNVARYFGRFGRDGVVLVPGIGAQGGEIGMLVRHFKKERLIANVGRGLMFPNGASSTPEEQAKAAKAYTDMLREIRNVD